MTCEGIGKAKFLELTSIWSRGIRRKTAGVIGIVNLPIFFHENCEPFELEIVVCILWGKLRGTAEVQPSDAA